MGRLGRLQWLVIAAALGCAIFVGVPHVFAEATIGEPRLVTNTPDFDMPVAWSADGSRILFSQGYLLGAPSKIGVAHTDFMGYELLREGVSEQPFAWSLDAQQIAFDAYSLDGDSLWVMNADGTGVRQVPGSESGQGGFVRGVGWTGDGRLMYFGRSGEFGPSVAALVPVMGGPTEVVGETQAPPTLSPDGFSMGLLGGDGTPRIVDLLSPADSRSFWQAPGTYARTSPRWSPDGSRVVWLSDSYDGDGTYWSQVWVADPSSFEPPLLALSVPKHVYTVSLSRDGAFIAIDAEDEVGPGSSVYVVPASGGTPTKLDGLHAGPTCPLWSPTADRLAVFSGDALYTVDVSGGASSATPHTSVIADAPGEWGEWLHYTGLITFASDQPGVTYHQWDSTASGGWTPGPAPLYPLQGLHTLYYYTEGLSGQVEPVQSQVVGIDGVPPTTPVVTSHAENGSGTYTITWDPCTDADSGVAFYEVWDGGTWKGYTPGTSLSLTGLDPSRSHLMYVVAKDHVGNGVSSATWTYTPGPRTGSVTLDHGIRLDFASITSGIPTGTAARVTGTGRLAAPSDRGVVGDAYFEISSSAAFTGDVTVTVPYDEAALGGRSESDVRLMHYANGQWNDVTISGSIDTVNNTVSGRTTSFSPFAVMAPLSAVPVVSTPASSTWSLPLAALLAVGTLAAFRVGLLGPRRLR